MKNYCYDCGLPIATGTGNKEHIPAKCFFVGFGNEYKTNRITVPTHISCNNKYSKIDQDLRDVIGVMTNNETTKNELISKSIRSIFSKSTGVERFSFESGSGFVDFNYDSLKMLHIKNFKGIFYHEYKSPIPATYRIEVISDGDQDLFPVERVGPIYGMINTCIPDWKVSGHQDIFKYKMGVLDVGNGNLTSFDARSSNQFIFSMLIYHEEVSSFVFAGTENALSVLHTK